MFQPSSLEGHKIGDSVTVCVAALCEAGKKIVTVSDQLISFTTGTAVDGIGYKNASLHPNWFAMYAADDITDVPSIIEAATAMLCSEKAEKFLFQVENAISLAYARRHDDLVKFKILRPNGFQDLDDFYERSRKLLTSAEFARMKRDIRATKPQCVFLVGGFDSMELGHLLYQEAYSPSQCLDNPGFWAIGSGQQEAMSALLFSADKLGFEIYNAEAECVYHLLSAKFMAESNHFVGHKTFVTVHAPNHSPRYMNPIHVEPIRQAWQKSAIPRLPRAVIKRIPKMIITVDEAQEMQKRFKELEKRMSQRNAGEKGTRGKGKAGRSPLPEIKRFPN